MNRAMLVRADALASSGAGHVLRCLPVAAAWLARGGRVLMLGRVESPELRQWIAESGVEFLALDASPGGNSDAVATLAALDRLGEAGPDGPATLLLDGYAFDAAYVAAVRAGGARVALVHDGIQLPDAPADVVLNHNLYAVGQDWGADAARLALLGPRYALLRPDVALAGLRPRDRERAKGRVLLTFGGSDPANFGGRTLEALRILGRRVGSAVLAAGPLNPRLAELRAAAADLDGVEVLDFTRDMAGLMAGVEVCLSAAGGSCMELCCLGTPFATVVAADNQAPVAEALARAGVARSLGRAEGLDAGELAAALAALLEDTPERWEGSQRGRKLVDGRGAARVAEALLGLEIFLREAREDDAQTLFAWANDPLTRGMSFNPAPIPWEEHVVWLLSRLGSPGKATYIGEDRAGRPVGQVRFDAQGPEAVASVAVAPESRGRGLAAVLIAEGSLAAMRDLGLERLVALVKPGNTASLRAFARAGYTPDGDAEVEGEGCLRLACDPPSLVRSLGYVPRSMEKTGE